MCLLAICILSLVKCLSKCSAHFQSDRLFSLSCKSFLYIVDPWITQVWTVWVHLSADFFAIYTIVPHDLWLAESWMQNCGYGGPTVKLYAEFWLCGWLAPLTPRCSMVNCIPDINPLSDMIFRYLLLFFGFSFQSLDSVPWSTKVLNFDGLTYLFFFCLCFWCHIQEIIAKSNIMKLFPYVLLALIIWRSGTL